MPSDVAANLGSPVPGRYCHRMGETCTGICPDCGQWARPRPALTCPECGARPGAPCDCTEEDMA